MNHSTTNPSDAAFRIRCAEFDNEVLSFLKDCTLTADALRPPVQQLAQEILALVGRHTPVTADQDEDAQVAAIAGFLLDVRAIAILPCVAALFIRVGLPAEAVTHEHRTGLDMALIDGIHLMRLAGFLDFDEADLQEAALLMSLDETSTKH